MYLFRPRLTFCCCFVYSVAYRNVDVLIFFPSCLVCFLFPPSLCWRQSPPRPRLLFSQRGETQRQGSQPSSRSANSAPTVAQNDARLFGTKEGEGPIERQGRRQKLGEPTVVNIWHVGRDRGLDPLDPMRSINIPGIRYRTDG